ncbi:hypothetical protein halTADL_0343 [Halohasta litchfieldiae]|jgi:hypothetical protein|uniref:Uncharacterized protein n=1 Tax=Halohasta litchfieldiae TaxID=1073996 RepID=A0A1H6TWH6_9EURY|nr:hypothetical protein halTADL_0343 [Halohasta litchfieldiae]SEI84361.1 hypothetical protein SAMN05444271_10963 [Halohasta litchfieldiae]
MSLPPSISRLGRLLHSFPLSSGYLLASARGIAFWTAIALPFGYLPMFGLEMVQLSLETFVVLLVINIVALVVGHSYHR